MAHKEPKLEVKEEEETRQNMSDAGARPKTKEQEVQVTPPVRDDSTTEHPRIIYCGHPSKEYQRIESLTAELESSMNVLKMTDNSVPITMKKLKELKKNLDKTSEMVKEKIELLTKNASSSPLPWHFHDRHGEHIELKEKKTLAEQTGKDSRTVVISDVPMNIGTCYKVQVKLKSTDDRSSDDGSTAESSHANRYLAVGVTWTDPETKDNEIKTAGFASKLEDSLIINSSNIIYNKETIRSNYGEVLKFIKEDSTVGIKIDDENCLQLYIDGNVRKHNKKIASFRFISPCWAVFDVRGNCTSIRIVPLAASV